MTEKKFTITNRTKSAIPKIPWLKIKEASLGKAYDLSLVFIGEKDSQKLNFSYRKKNKPTNILSFTLNKTKGEIFITPKIVRQETAKFGRTFSNLLAFLFIHGIMHLKGMEHGSRMNKAEEMLRNKFGI